MESYAELFLACAYPFSGLTTYKQMCGGYHCEMHKVETNLLSRVYDFVFSIYISCELRLCTLKYVRYFYRYILLECPIVKSYVTMT
jgi:hypothetical protein